MIQSCLTEKLSGSSISFKNWASWIVYHILPQAKQPLLMFQGGVDFCLITRSGTKYQHGDLLLFILISYYYRYASAQEIRCSKQISLPIWLPRNCSALCHLMAEAIRETKEKLHIIDLINLWLQSFCACRHTCTHAQYVSQFHNNDCFQAELVLCWESGFNRHS